MPVVDCDVSGCDYKTNDVGDAVGAVMLGHHIASAHPIATSQYGQPSAPSGQPSDISSQPSDPSGQPSGQPSAPSGQPSDPSGQPSASSGHPSASLLSDPKPPTYDEAIDSTFVQQFQKLPGEVSKLTHQMSRQMSRRNYSAPQAETGEDEDDCCSEICGTLLGGVLAIIVLGWFIVPLAMMGVGGINWCTDIKKSRGSNCTEDCPYQLWLIIGGAAVFLLNILFPMVHRKMKNSSKQAKISAFVCLWIFPIIWYFFGCWYLWTYEVYHDATCAYLYWLVLPLVVAGGALAFIGAGAFLWYKI